jgi:hypothetical protein
MPQDHRHGYAGSHPTGRANNFAAPTHDLEDAILRATRAADNPVPFTAEHRAAYAAFCGITDHKSARALHRANVTWDDVHEYTAQGISVDGFNQMISLRRAGVTPEILHTWNQHLGSAIRNVAALAQIYHPINGDPHLIRSILNLDADEWRRSNGITTAYMRAHSRSAPDMVLIADAELTRTYLGPDVTTSARPDLDAISDWAKVCRTTGLHPRLAGLLLLNGVAPQNAPLHPDPDSLVILAALTYPLPPRLAEPARDILAA